MDLTQYTAFIANLTLHPELLKQLLNSPEKWEIIDTFMANNLSHYTNINNLFKECLKMSEISLVSKPTIYGFITKGINIFVFIFFWQAVLQLKMVLIDPIYAQEQLAKSFYTTMDELIYSTKAILKFYEKINLPFIQLLQLQYLIKDYFFKSNNFQELFNEKLIAYILEQINQENVSLEFLELLAKLIHF